jgi:hypothetical protein
MYITPISSPTADRQSRLRGTLPLDAYTGHGGTATNPPTIATMASTRPPLPVDAYTGHAGAVAASHP